MNFNQKENNAGKIGLFLVGVNDRLKEHMYQIGQSTADKIIEESTDNGGWQPPGADRWQKKMGQISQRRNTKEAQTVKTKPAVKSEEEQQTVGGKIGRVLVRLVAAAMALGEMEAERQEAEKKASPKKENAKQKSDINQGKTKP